MTKTLSITIDNDLYRALKKAAGPRGMSRFIGDAVRHRLLANRKHLYREYRAASKDRQRILAINDWDALDDARAGASA